MHFGFMKGILLHTGHQHAAASHSCGGKSKNTNVFIMCQDYSTDKNQRVLVRIPVKW
jgi:hypothetical protein